MARIAWSSGSFAAGQRSGVSTMLDLAVLYLPVDGPWDQPGVVVAVTSGVGYDLY
jgi:hypothetical protein